MTLFNRAAAAPISWGVSEVPDWGYQLAPARVLAEIRGLGLTATELGPDGYFLSDPQVAAAISQTSGFSVVGGFVPATLHQSERSASWKSWGCASLLDSLVSVDRAARRLAAAGAEILVLAVTGGESGYDSHAELDAAGWGRLVQAITIAESIGAGHGLRTALHPHFGTTVATAADVARLLETSEVALCLDSGHLVLGGVDPVAFARAATGRIVHVHLKDVDGALARRLSDGELGYAEAVRAGLYRPLGCGDAPIANLIDVLEGSGYDGWYVLEQDVALVGEPPAGEGPRMDIERSLAFLKELDGVSSARA
ncbi:MAG: sugar phosphate isomerase/epimerase [Dehalococcoidia bacterium]